MTTPQITVSVLPAPINTLAGYKTQCEALLARAQEMTVADKDGLTSAAQFIIDLKQADKEIEAKCLEWTRPIMLKKDMIYASFMALRNPIKGAIAEIDKKMRDFAQVQQEAERKAREQQIEAWQEDARQHPAAHLHFPTPVPTEVPKVIQTEAGTAKLEEEWDYEIFDINLIPRELMIPDEKALKHLAKTKRAAASCPGVKFFSRPKVSTRKAREQKGVI